MAKRPHPVFSPDLALPRGNRHVTVIRDSRDAETRARTSAKDDLAALPEQLTLAKAQAFHAYVRRGTVFHVKQGSVWLTPAARWLAATVWAAPVHLPAGHAYVAEDTGWLVLSTDGGAELFCHAVEAPPARWYALAWRALRERLGA